MKIYAKTLSLFTLVIAFSFINVPQKIVVIDVGHGGKDPGMTTEEIDEKDINLSIANKIVDLSKKSNTKVILTRDTDKFMSLQDRVEYINSLNPTCVISLHVNTSENENARGAELYISNNGDGKNESREFAEIVKENLPESLYDSKIRVGSFYLLKKLNCPATILEMGFLSNRMDKAFLMSKKGQNEMAQAIFKSVK